MSSSFHAYAEFRGGVECALGTFIEKWTKLCGEPGYDEWELEVRLGHAFHWTSRERVCPDTVQKLKTTVSDTHFDTDVEPALFHQLLERLSVRKGCSKAPLEVSYVSDGAARGTRTVHTAEHVDCLCQKKEELVPPQNYAGSASFDVRLATSVERSLDYDACATTPPPTLQTKRERCKLRFADIECWELHFTRIDAGVRFQIELELDWPASYARLRRAYAALGAAVPVSFEQFMKHCVVQELIMLLERVERAALKCSA